MRLTNRVGGVGKQLAACSACVLGFREIISAMCMRYASELYMGLTSGLS
jgi:hypothetical protein